MSSKRRLRRRSCVSKQRFADQTAAVAALKRLHRNLGNHAHKTYRCHFCSGWHIGRPNRAAAQSARARRLAGE